MSIQQQAAAKALSALGHDVRLQIYRLLVRAGEDGMSVGDIGVHLGVAPSTLAHHLTALVQTRLVTQQRQGRIVFNHVDFDRMRALISYLSDECCAGVTLINSEDAA